MRRSPGLTLYRWRYAVLAAWAAVVLAALPVAPRVFQTLSPGGFSSPSLEAQRADDLLARKFQAEASSLVVVFEDPTGQITATSPRFQEAVQATVARLRQAEGVANVMSPLDNPRQVSPDGRAAYASIQVRAADGGPASFRRLVAAIDDALAGTRLKTTLTGPQVFYADIYDVTEQDLRRAELISFPFAGLALLFVFGSVVAAAVPGLVGGAAVVVTLALMVFMSQLTELSIFSLNLTTMLGLGLGIDYSLFIVSRYREELAAGATVPLAIDTALQTAGRAVLFSGATVLLGLLGLLFFDFSALRSLGIAGALVVGVCVIAALTLLPAALGVIGTRIDALAVRRPRPPGRVDPTSAAAHAGFWARLAHLVMAHPFATLVPVLALLIGLGLPFMRVQLGAPDASVLPTWVQSRQGFDLLRERWGEGELSPILLVFQTTDGGSPLRPEPIAGLYDFVRRIEADPRVERVESVVSLDPRISRAQYQLIYGNGDLSRVGDAYARLAGQASVRADTVVVRVTSRYGQVDDRSKQLIRDLRATPVTAGLDLTVGGVSAGIVDYADLLFEQFPRAALFVVIAIYLVLLLTFHSLLLPLKAILMNTLSILASYGALVVIFQEGALSGILGFKPLGFVEASLPIIMFCVLFGLSMDYEVFLLTRVKEAYDRGSDNRASVALGLEQSGRIITSAAAIVVLVSSSFVTADIVLIKALGLGTAIAVFVDATVVRALLVPATMRLLGDWNWWAPGWLRRRLPSIGLHSA
ncbi:MAG: MMPL family transporter [Chloroflexi bacterium]|nr:MMPL family transporter [Chloroflexota bacterium]